MANFFTNIIVLPDGTELSSGPEAVNNIRSVSLTKCVNSETELALGSVCSAMLECKLQTPYAALGIETGTEVTLYKSGTSGSRTKVGLFTIEKPARPSAHTYKITAYDRVSWLDKDLTDWLAALDGWPYTVSVFAEMVCGACGLTLAQTQWINGGYEIQQFVGNGITGRKLMQWIGEIEAKFIRANADGEIELAWYTASGKTITPDGSLYYLGGSLSYEDYQVAPVERVRIRLTSDDVGVSYPESGEDLNTYAITGNYLLTTTNSALLDPVAQNIQEALSGFTYTPCEVKIPTTPDIDAGDLVDITDANGVTITMCVMTMTQAGQNQTLECTGSPARDSSTAVNNTTFGALNAKMLEVQRSIEGLSVKAVNIQTTVEEGQRTTQEQIAALQLQADSIKTTVEADLGGLEERLSTVEQDAESVSVRVEKIETDGATKVNTGAGMTLDADGLHVYKDGEATTSTLDFDGLDVTRSSDGEAVLVADANGVNALNVTVRKYLITGNTRFESFSNGTDANRTAMFYVGG